MKKFYWLPAAALALMLGACSSDDVVSGTEGTGPQWNADGKGYVSLAINLPQDRSTMSRAANDQFDDGDPSEYDVHSAILVVFAGDDEASATFSGAYDLDISSIDKVEDIANQITSTVRLTQAINAVPEGQNLYALVILNPGTEFTVGANNSLSIAGSSFGTNKSFSDFQEHNIAIGDGDVSSIASATNGFLMLNAPLASRQGRDWATLFESGAATINTLTPLDGQVYATAAEAESHPAAEVYVERAVAKVTVTASKESGDLDNPSGEGSTTGDGTTPTRAWEIAGWSLNNMNNWSYYVRNAETSDSWWAYRSAKISPQTSDAEFRFIGTSDVAAGAGYRTYWAKDPNYNVTLRSGALYSPWYAKNLTADDLTDVGGSLYCLENTFDVAHQTQNQTTTVIVAAKFNNGGTFYTLGNSTSTFYNKDGLDISVKNAFVNDPAVKAAVQGKLKSGASFDATDIQSITYSTTTEAGDVTVTGITYAEDFASDFTDNNIPEALATPSGDSQTGGSAYEAGIANADGLNIKCYADGMAYYPVLIKHFGDDLTPWDASDVENGNSYPGTDEVAAQNWLGRYGVLRNNWYTINVNNISNLGYPKIDRVMDPDDPPESYISVEINVLSWAVRLQDVNL